MNWRGLSLNSNLAALHPLWRQVLPSPEERADLCPPPYPRHRNICFFEEDALRHKIQTGRRKHRKGPKHTRFPWSGLTPFSLNHEEPSNLTSTEQLAAPFTGCRKRVCSSCLFLLKCLLCAKHLEPVSSQCPLHEIRTAGSLFGTSFSCLTFP